MLVIRLLDSQPNHIAIYGATRSFRQHQPDFLTVDIKYHVSSHLINLSYLMLSIRGVSGCAVPLHLLFRFMPSQPYSPIHEVVVLAAVVGTAAWAWMQAGTVVRARTQAGTTVQA